MKNYRPISLLSNVYKLFTKILTDRINYWIENTPTRDQVGFRSGRSTMDHLQTLNQLREKANEFNILLSLPFIDFVSHDSSVG